MRADGRKDRNRIKAAAFAVAIGIVGGCILLRLLTAFYTFIVAPLLSNLPIDAIGRSSVTVGAGSVRYGAMINSVIEFAVWAAVVMIIVMIALVPSARRKKRIRKDERGPQGGFTPGDDPAFRGRYASPKGFAAPEVPEERGLRRDDVPEGSNTQEEDVPEEEGAPEKAGPDNEDIQPVPETEAEEDKKL